MLYYPNAKVYIYKSEYEAIISESQKYAPYKTNGDLYGTFTHGNKPVIWLALARATVSGSDTRATKSIHNINQIQKTLMSDYAIEHIGSWTSHPILESKVPSSGHVCTEHNGHLVLDIIVNHQHITESTFKTSLITCLGNNYQQQESTEVSLEQLREKSPIRRFLADKFSSIEPISGVNTAFDIKDQEFMNLFNIKNKYNKIVSEDLKRQLDILRNSYDVKVNESQDVDDVLIFQINLSESEERRLEIHINESNQTQISKVILIDKMNNLNEDITEDLSKDSLLRRLLNCTNISNILIKTIEKLPEILSQK